MIPLFRAPLRSWKRRSNDRIERISMTEINFLKKLAVFIEYQPGRAFWLLQGTGNPTDFSIITLAFDVLVLYGWKATRPRRTSVDSLLVMQATPQNVVFGKCSGCHSRVLDDPFAYYLRFDPTVYVTWSLENTCGLPGCPITGS